jgi:hypothetical protein
MVPFSWILVLVKVHFGKRAMFSEIDPQGLSQSWAHLSTFGAQKDVMPSPGSLSVCFRLHSGALLMSSEAEVVLFFPNIGLRLNQFFQHFESERSDCFFPYLRPPILYLRFRRTRRCWWSSWVRNGGLLDHVNAPSVRGWSFDHWGNGSPYEQDADWGQLGDLLPWRLPWNGGGR